MAKTIPDPTNNAGPAEAKFELIGATLPFVIGKFAQLLADRRLRKPSLTRAPCFT